MISKYQIDYTYDDNGNITIAIDYKWSFEDNDWSKYTQTEYTYDADDNLIMEIKYSWINDILKEPSKTEYAYDNNGNLTLDKIYDWDAVNNDWLDYAKREYAYNNNGNQTLSASYRWENNNWRGVQKSEHLYDDNVNMTWEINYDWDVAKNDWKECTKTESVADISYLVEDIVFPTGAADDVGYYKWLFSNFNNMLTETKSYERINNNMEYIRNIRYYYSSHIVNIAEPLMVNIRVYPNPARSQFTVTNAENAEIQLYNMLGQKVLQIHSKEENAVVSVGSLPQGMYVLKVMKDNFLFTHKVVVRE